ncbi:gamma-glutamyl-gamma-aminobutyrate hydrolase family protein [Nocardioides nematodiphilus]|uniref:gamma-glutamyl-gamma-aminobutyrate hydrolase family protein n=1 Tax=Nocardioides nematodiphilus TaxID=2849669 RepID=UPI001CDA4FA9|nr:gamma-glutamyl-gamma-aminobutyrate hydrolase family protein [Nocardioides nematodiphilus]MCA1984590.1 gamma-glutamyl-gamma-aminobutyrate hydrolase family protein [Nocardioides nematodiphilus]
MRPLIVIPGRRSPQVSVLRFSGTIASEAMCEAVWAAGGEPLILHGPDADPADDLAARLSRFDGVVMPGGGDMDPARFGETPAPEAEPPMAHDDDLDFEVAAVVLSVGLPTLAICRGLQVVNVALGGTLHQHLPDGEVAHRNAVHDVVAEAGSRLRAVAGRDRLQVSSYHHQAVDRVGRGLTVVARAADGCVEALEHDSGRLLAVQWHPEDLHATNDTDAALFADLVERAAKHAADR